MICPDCSTEMKLIQGMVYLCGNCGRGVESISLGSHDPASTVEPDIPCPLRGPRLQEAECKLCGLRGIIINVYACSVYETCTVGARGIEGAHVCVGCESNPLSPGT